MFIEVVAANYDYAAYSYTFNGHSQYQPYPYGRDTGAEHDDRTVDPAGGYVPVYAVIGIQRSFGDVVKMVSPWLIPCS